jgi:imidazolonepropionase-like amidohydrolase
VPAASRRPADSGDLPAEDKAAILIRGGQILDVATGSVSAGSVLVRGERIVAVGDVPDPGPGTVVLDADGRTIMPGLIDCHVHIDAAAMVEHQSTERTVSVGLAYRELTNSLLRGFTTVRDVGGADAGFKTALELGLVRGPRLFVAGRPLSQTGGHGDVRARHTEDVPTGPQNSRIADGVDEVRQAVRDNLRRGADHIKMMVSGGISSPTDLLDGSQYSDEEIAVAVQEAGRAGSYVAAHAYSDEAVARSAELGVRTIEHGSLIGDRAALAMAERGAIMVPTLSPYHWVTRIGDRLGLPVQHRERAAAVQEDAVRAVALAARHGVALALGSDLFRTPREHQSYEVVLRAQVQPTIEVLRSATMVGAQVVGLGDRLGQVRAGYLADLLVVDGNPLDDLSVLQEQGAHLAVVMRGGVPVVDRLSR